MPWVIITSLTYQHPVLDSASEPESFTLESTIRFADRLVIALSGRVDLGARRVWGKLGNLLGLLSPAPSDISEFCAHGEPEASRCLLTCCQRAGEAGLKSMFLVSLGSVHEIMRAVCQVLWLFNCWTFQVSFVICTDFFVGST